MENPLMRKSKKHVCDYRDCQRMARWKHVMCHAHGSAGCFKPESRELSDKSKTKLESNESA